MNDKTSTRDHNLEVLIALGFRRVGNTTVFKHGSLFILSPAVSEGTNGKYWFDIREVNLNRIDDKSVLLVRIVPDIFIVERLANLSPLLDQQVMDNRPHSGNVWGIHIDLDARCRSASLYNIKKPSLKVSTKLLEKSSVPNAYEEAVNQSV